MRAAVYDRYGPPEVVELREVPTPEPAEGEIRIRSRATTVTSGDWRARSLEMPAGFGLMGRLVFGISKPRQPILGTELAGDVESVGKGVSGFHVGDRVFAFAGAGMGGHAELKCMPEGGAVARMPSSMTYAQAAAISFGGTTALSFFRRGQLRKGEKVLINGASGGVGTAAVQLAKHFGAEVTAVCGAGNAELVRSLGADRVIDYTSEDFTADGRRYDVIVDTVGTAPFSRSRGSLEERGRLLLVLGGLADLLGTPWVSLTTRKRIVAGPAAGTAEDLRFLGGLVEKGEFKAVIDREYAFEQIVDAHRYVDTGRKRGSVVVIL